MALRLHRFKDRDTRRLFGVILTGKSEPEAPDDVSEPAGTAG